MSGTRQLVELESYWPSCGQTLYERPSRTTVHNQQGDSLSSSQQVALARTIESEIIPRLLLVHRASINPAAPKPVTNWCPGPQDIQEFAALLRSGDASAAKSHVAAVCAQGTPLDAVFISLFAPAARYLGELWDRDICDFTDVTIALSRLQQILRELAPGFNEHAVVTEGAKKAFLAVAPGEQHTLGLFMVQEFFRSAGWQVSGGLYETADEVLNAARSEPFDLVGLSVSCDAPVEDLFGLVRALRKGALNPAVRMMVGGRFFLEHPELVSCVGADATAPDGRRAVPPAFQLA